MHMTLHASAQAEGCGDAVWTTRRAVLAQNFPLECGGVLPTLEVCYTTAGELSPAADNVVWIFHALTANSNPSEWWSSLVGTGRALDPRRHFIVCANILGSCYGTTGPSTRGADGASSLGVKFPLVTMRDVVRAHKLLREFLGIGQIWLGIGGSMGGHQAIEWACGEPDTFSQLVLIATSARHSPWGIACNEAQRMAMSAEEGFANGNPEAGARGLKAARAVAMLTYRGYTAFSRTQLDTTSKVDFFAASSYMRHQGEKIAARFCPYSYWTLTKTMDSHDVSRDRGSIKDALRRVMARTLVVAIASDALFPPCEQRVLAEGIPGAIYAEIDSLLGHDGFLVEGKRIEELLVGFLPPVGPDHQPVDRPVTDSEQASSTKSRLEVTPC